MVSVRRVAPVLLLIAAIPLFGATKVSHPPRELHQVGDHWTAYFPPDPATYPAGSKTYAIKRGDSLWAIASSLYGNPYLWPQLWESNTWITDAHWIYPGDVLLVEGEAAGRTADNNNGTPQPAQPGGGTRVSGGPTGGKDTLNASITPPESTDTGVPVPLGSEGDVYCYGYIGDPNENLPNAVASYEDVEMRYQPGAAVQSMGGSLGDLMFVDGGTATGITVGETYLVVEPQDLVENPATHQVIGRFYDFRGQIRIIRADEHKSCAVVVQSCMEIHVGNRIKPMPQLPIPLAHVPALPPFCDPLVQKSSGYIIRAQGGWRDALGVGLLVEVNVGKEDNVNSGDFLTVWRPSVQPEQPPQILGEIGILTTEAHTATGRIMEMRYHMMVGDHVELR